MQHFLALSFRSPCPVWEQTHYHEVFLHSFCNWREKILYVPVNHPRCKHQLHSLLCLWAHFTSGKHCNSGTKFCLMDTNSAVMYSFFFFFFVKNTYICTGKNAKLKERKLEFSSWFCHPDSGQVSWAHFPHL